MKLINDINKKKNTNTKIPKIELIDPKTLNEESPNRKFV